MSGRERRQERREARRAKFGTARPALRRMVKNQLADPTLTEEHRANLQAALKDDRLLEQGYQRLTEVEGGGGRLASLAKILANIVELGKMLRDIFADIKTFTS